MTALIAMEVGRALWIRDGLTLNIIVLVHPVEAIQAHSTTVWWVTGPTQRLRLISPLR